VSQGSVCAPNLQKLGIEIMAITFGNWSYHQYLDTRVSETRDYTERHPNLLFLLCRRALSSDRVAVTVHRDYSDYMQFMQEIGSDWGEFMDVTGSFLISLSSDDPLGSIAFRYLADYLENEKD